MEALCVGLLLHRRVQRFDHRGAQGLGYVADAHAVQVRSGMPVQVGFRLPGDMVEEVGFLEIRVAEVGRQHGITPVKNKECVRHHT